MKYYIAQIVVANFVWNFRIFSYKCCHCRACYGTNVSLLVAAELAAVLLGGCGSHRSLRGGRHAALQDIYHDVKNYYHYYHYLTYLSLSSYQQENGDVNFNVNESIEVCIFVK